MTRKKLRRFNGTIIEFVEKTSNVDDNLVGDSTPLLEEVQELIKVKHVDFIFQDGTFDSEIDLQPSISQSLFWKTFVESKHQIVDLCWRHLANHRYPLLHTS